MDVTIEVCKRDIGQGYDEPLYPSVCRYMLENVDERLTDRQLVNLMKSKVNVSGPSQMAWKDGKGKKWNVGRWNIPGSDLCFFLTIDL